MYFDPALFKIQFRRRSESGEFAALRWTYIVFSVVGLMYFGVSAFQELAARNFVMVQNPIFITGEPWRLPDLIVCTANVTSVDYDRVFNYTSYAIKGPSVPEGQYVRSPCLLPEHDTVFNFIFNFTTGQVLPKRNIDEILRRITFETNSTVPIQFTLVHRRFNIYAKRVLFSNEEPDKRGEDYQGSASEELDDVMYNNHYAQTGTTTYITSSLTFRWRLRGDFFGWFSMHGGSVPDAMVSSTIEAVPSSPGKTVLVMIIPITASEEFESLVLSIGGALGSWGGVFSLVGSIYYFLFGTGKMTPFGYVQRFLLRRGTKRMIKRDYADEDKCASDPSDTKEKGPHTQHQYQPPTEAAPFWNASTYPMLDQKDPSRNYMQTGDNNGSEILRQLSLLRTAHEDVLQRLKKQEARSRHNEHLIRGFYLDMHLIDEALESPETIQDTSIHTAHHLQSGEQPRHTMQGSEYIVPC
ncbi:MAG: hypothetical protein J3Q66DRAFT_352285 [Benniella sp.]|nr:MAG: hypothetical protein J3Q66DRAFT_352285 [Benniella sp.]